MSIALSAELKPSNTLLLLVGLQCLATAAAGVALGGGWVGALEAPQRASVVALCLLAAGFGFISTLRARKSLRLDISAGGEIRLAEYGARGGDGGLGSGDPIPSWVADGRPLELLEGSTLWPRLLVLRLGGGPGRPISLVVLPDCTDPQTFRSLAVAMRWIAARTA